MRQFLIANLAAHFAIICSGAPVGAGVVVSIDVYNSGVDDSGAQLNAGEQDPHFMIVDTGAAAIVRGSRTSGYYQDPDAKWIWLTEDGTYPPPTRPIPPVTIRTTFDLTNLDHNTAAITGVWSADNLGEIFLNGISTGIELVNGANRQRNWTRSHSFEIRSGFVAGVNTLDFRVVDLSTVDGQGGLRVELAGTAETIPEPAGLPLLGILTIAVACRHRKSCSRRMQST
jgi:hypothetical protein